VSNVEIVLQPATTLLRCDGTSKMVVRRQTCREHLGQHEESRGRRIWWRGSMEMDVGDILGDNDMMWMVIEKILGGYTQ